MKSSTQTAWWRIVTLLSIWSTLLAACGTPPQAIGTSDPSTSASINANSAAETSAPAGLATSATPSQATAPKELVYHPEVSGTIDFWHFWGSALRRNAIRKIIAMCEQKLPNIKVNETHKPFGDIWTANIASVSAGSGMPDVIVEDRPKLPDRAINGITQPITNLANRDGVDASQFWPFTWQETMYDGQSYGVPFETDVRVLYYNKTAFKEVGLDPEKPPRTWAELAAYADKLDKKNAAGEYERIAFFPLMNSAPYVWGYTNGTNWLTSEGRPQLNTPQAAETLEWVKMWIDRYGGWQAIEKFRSNFQGAPNDAFMTGRLAMFVDINGYSSQLRLFDPQVPTADGKTQDLEWGVTHLPYNVENGSWSGGFALSIPRGAKNPDAGWEFIKCATSREAQASWARDTQSMPANRIAASDPALLVNPNWKLFVDAMGYSQGTPFMPQYPNWMEQLEMRYDQVWRGQLPVDVALEQAQEIVEQEINKNSGLPPLDQR